MIIQDDPAPGKAGPGRLVPFDGAPFEMIPLAMLRDIRRIEPIDIRLWGIMLHDARFRGHCEHTDAQLAALAGVSQQTVRRSLLRLTRAGYIDRMGGRCRRIILNAQGDGIELPTLKVRSV